MIPLSINSKLLESFIWSQIQNCIEKHVIHWQKCICKMFWLIFQQGGGLDVLSERFPPQQATPPLMMEERPNLYSQPYSSPSPTANLSSPFQGMVRQKPSLGTMPVQVTPPRGAFSPGMGMQPRQTLNRPPAAPNQLRLQLQQRLQGQQQVSTLVQQVILFKGMC